MTSLAATVHNKARRFSLEHEKEAMLRFFVFDFQQCEIHAEQRIAIPGSMPKPGSMYLKINISMSQGRQMCRTTQNTP